MKYMLGFNVIYIMIIMFLIIIFKCPNLVPQSPFTTLSLKYHAITRNRQKGDGVNPPLLLKNLAHLPLGSAKAHCRTGLNLTANVNLV